MEIDLRKEDGQGAHNYCFKGRIFTFSLEVSQKARTTRLEKCVGRSPLALSDRTAALCTRLTKLRPSSITGPCGRGHLAWGPSHYYKKR